MADTQQPGKTEEQPPKAQPAQEWGERHEDGVIKERGGKDPGPSPNEQHRRDEKKS